MKLSKSVLIFGLIIVIFIKAVGFTEPLNDLEKNYHSLVESQGNDQSNFYNSVRLAEDAAGPFLISKLPKADPVVKSAILTALQLAKVPCRSTAPFVEDELSNSFWLTRYNASAYLALEQCTSSSRKIIQKLQEETDVRVKSVFIDSIGLIGNSNDESLLKSYQDNSNNDQKIRLAAATALARLGRPFDENFCQTFLSTENDDLTPRAIEALSHSRNVQALASFDSLTTKDEPIGSSARIGKERLTMNIQNYSTAQKVNRYWDIVNSSDDIYLLPWAIKELLNTSHNGTAKSNLKKIAMTISKSNHSPENTEVTQSLIKQNIVRSVLLKEGIMKNSELIEITISDRTAPHDH